MKNKNSAASSVTLLVTTAMFAALTLLATSVLKIQTPTFGYIHLGDGLVLLAGIFLGPVFGGFAAGIGSALSDFLGGYAIWVPGTFVIKYLTAAAASAVFRRISARSRRQPVLSVPALVTAGIAGEAVMILGYFLYNILIVAFTAGSLNGPGLLSAAALSLAEIPFNAVQGAAGILIASLLAPVLVRAHVMRLTLV